jgi:hypothetical protein
MRGRGGVRRASAAPDPVVEVANVVVGSADFEAMKKNLVAYLADHEKTPNDG